MAAYDDETMQLLRFFGSQIKHLRNLRGYTQEEFGKRIGYAVDTIASIEQGRRIAQARFYALADDALEANGLVKAAEAHISMKTKYPAFFAEFAEEERKAITLDYFASQAIPGLIQTEAYAQAMFESWCPPYEDEETARLVNVRLERQELFARKPLPVLGFVIEENVLRRPLGGPEVLHEQLLQVLEIGKRSNVTIQVMPQSCRQHAGLNGAMTLMETAERQMVAYVEHQAGSQWVTKPAEFSVLHQRYGIIRAQALTTADSMALIEKVAGEL